MLGAFYSLAALVITRWPRRKPKLSVSTTNIVARPRLRSNRMRAAGCCKWALDAERDRKRIAELEKERQEFVDLMCKYQCNPTNLLTVYEALRNHMETAQRLCNDNYAWAKRVEAERDEAVRRWK